MKAYSCYFGSGRFEAMANALRASLERNGGCDEIEIESVAPPAKIHTFTSNTEKLGHWRRQVDAAQDGAKLVLLDSDTIVTHSLAPAFEAFVSAVAMTDKGPAVSRMRYNCGVVFVHCGPAAKAFFARWQSINDEFLRNRGAHAPYEAKHGGINQAAWGCMRDMKDPLCSAVSDLPCATWNACYPPLWARAAEASVIHYKSDLRISLFHGGARYTDLVALWREYERLSRDKRS
jgi:hypothetical protein